MTSGSPSRVNGAKPLQWAVFYLTDRIASYGQIHRDPDSSSEDAQRGASSISRIL